MKRLAGWLYPDLSDVAICSRCNVTNQSLVSCFCLAEVNKNHFNFQYVIGRGGFGKVWKVELRKEKKLFAMKEMAKARIISKRSVNSVMNEKKFLCQLHHP